MYITTLPAPSAPPPTIPLPALPQQHQQHFRPTNLNTPTRNTAHSKVFSISSASTTSARARGLSVSSSNLDGDEHRIDEDMKENWFLNVSRPLFCLFISVYGRSNVWYAFSLLALFILHLLQTGNFLPTLKLVTTHIHTYHISRMLHLMSIYFRVCGHSVKVALSDVSIWFSCRY